MFFLNKIKQVDEKLAQIQRELNVKGNELTVTKRLVSTVVDEDDVISS